MFKYSFVLFTIVACALAKPSGVVAPVGYSTPLLGSGVVTATSSQVVARNYNGIAAPYFAAAPANIVVSAPAPVPVAAPFTAHAPVAVAAPFAKYTAEPLKYSPRYSIALAGTVAHSAPYDVPLTYPEPVSSYAHPYTTPYAYAAHYDVL